MSHVYLKDQINNLVPIVMIFFKVKFLNYFLNASVITLSNNNFKTGGLID